MQTRLAGEFRDTPDGQAGEAILRRCVHCGFCTATCPTYQLLGDELDGPRGRIHLVKQVLEGESVSERTRLHLDRCLTCRACETTCPSGVEYGRLLDIGRRAVERRAPRPLLQRGTRRLLAAFLTGPLFAPMVRASRLVQPLLPARLRTAPLRAGKPLLPVPTQSRRMLLLAGCVQPALAPGIDAALARILGCLGISLVTARAAGCCGAIHHHLSLEEQALDRMRRNIDAWWPLVESGVEAVLASATGCGATLREYGHLLRNDARYAARAARISALARDPVEVLGEHLPQLSSRRRNPPAVSRISFHAPCSLQHGLRLRGAVEPLLRAFGAELIPVANAPGCCGSAGTYSLLQPEISAALARSMAVALEAGAPELILSANIGCIRQIGNASGVPVMHWLEWIEMRLQAS